jgi:hypothetical protein
MFALSIYQKFPVFCDKIKTILDFRFTLLDWADASKMEVFTLASHAHPPLLTLTPRFSRSPPPLLSPNRFASLGIIHIETPYLYRRKQEDLIFE